MFRPRSSQPAAYSYECPTGGVRYYFRTDPHACGTDAAATRNDLACVAANAVGPGGQPRQYEYVDVDEESDQPH